MRVFNSLGRTEIPVVDIDFMQDGDIPCVSQLCAAVFTQFEAPECTPEGTAEFLEFVQENQFRERMASSERRFDLVAKIDGMIAGVIEVRDWEHISMLFVDPAFHQQGVGTALFQRALTCCQEERPDLARITVKSSPFAVGIYEKLGFKRTGEQQSVKGNRFIPMDFECKPAPVD